MSIRKHLALLLTIISLNTFAQLSGTYNIGTGSGDDYACLTCTNGIFKAIADSGVSGSVTINITTDLPNETGDEVLKGWAAPHSVEISTKTASVKTITYNNSASGILLKLDSVTFFTINGSVGGNGRYLRFVSAQTDYAIVEINNDCKKVQILNCEFQSDNKSTALVFAGAINLRSYGKTGNDEITFNNNLIEDKPNGTNLRYGIMVSPPILSGQEVEKLTITSNEFNNINFIGIELAAGIGTINSAVITGNSFYASSVWKGSNDSEPMSFIYLNNGIAHHVQGNFFGGQSKLSGGSKMNIDLDKFSNILHVFRVGSGVSGTRPIKFRANYIKNIQVYGPTASDLNLVFFKVNASCKVPVEIGSDSVSYLANVIGDTTVNASSLTSSNIYIKERRNSSNNSFFVCQVEGSAKQRITNNKIGGILLDNGSSLGLTSQFIYCSGSSDIKISKNQIGGTAENIVKNCRGDFRMIYSKGQTVISENSLDGISAIGSFENDFSIIQVDPNLKDVAVISNTTGKTGYISVSNTATTPKSLYGINISGGNAKDLSIVRNSLDNIKVIANTNTNVTHAFGIKPVVSVSGICRVDSNYVFLSQESNGEVVGIDFFSPNNSGVSVKGNTIRATTRNFFENQLIGIDFTGKVIHNNRVEIYGNLIGDTSITISTNNAAIWLNGGATGKSATSFGIRVSQPNDFVEVSSNAVGGVYSKSSGREIPFIPILVASVRDSLNVMGNHIGNSNGIENIWYDNHSEFEYSMYLDLPDGLQNARINNNKIGGVKYSATGSDTRIFGIRATRGTTIGNVWLKNNIVSNIKIEGSGEKEFTALFTNNNNTHILENTVANILVKSSKLGDQFWGIYVDEGSSSHEIRSNRINGIKLTQNQNAGNNAIGIFFAGVASTFDITGNIVKGFDLGISDSTAIFQGILVTSCKTADIHNNVVLHNPGLQVSSQQAYGIYDFAKAGDIFIYHNTIDLKVDMAPGSSGKTACYLKNNDATRKISNNLFANHSANVGGPHYALFFATSSGAIGSDFNLLTVVADPNKLVRFGIDYGIVGWQQKGFGIKSISPPSQNLVDQNNGKQLTSLGNDIGLTNLGVAIDLAGNSRPLDGGYDLGAYELATSSLPSGITGLNSFTKETNGFELFPNPASDVIHLSFNTSPVNGLELQIFSSSGQMVMQYFPNGMFDSIDINNLQSGMYIIRLIDENGVVKERRFSKI